MRSYYSLTYLWLFLPLCMLAYQAFPRQHRWKVLLGASFLFYWSFSQKLVVYLLLSTVLIHYFGLWMASVQSEKKLALAGAEKSEKKAIKARYQKSLKWIMLVGVLSNLAILVTLKYSRFLGGNLNTLFANLGIGFQFRLPHFMLPLGISFYTMQAMSYLLDIYRGTLEPDRNFWRLSLYMSFFPQIMEGPIARYGQTADQLWAGEPITYHNMTFGMQRIIWGCFKKHIADHLNILVEPVFQNLGIDGGLVALGMVCYTCQLYMEFSGTMDVVIGTAEIFGIRLPENFQQPFFSKSVSEFWKRWHITLGAWFRDYVFYPVSMSKTVKKLTGGARKRFGAHTAAILSGAVALFCVWVFNGLWHGEDWQYLFFGMYHFVLIFLGSIAEPISVKFCEKHHLNRDKGLIRIFRIARTILLVNIGELFFRAEGLKKGMDMFRTMVTGFTMKSLNFATLGNFFMDKRRILMLLTAGVIVLLVSLMREKGIDVREKIAQQNIVVRWLIYYGIILFIVLFGAYGVNYKPLDPIYANF